MSEQKSPEQFYSEHEKVSDDLAGAKEIAEYQEEKAIKLEATPDRPPYEYPSIDALHFRDAANRWQEKAERLQDKHDANLWRAREHYKAHEGEYHDQAVQDAKADGVEIKVEEPKE